MARSGGRLDAAVLGLGLRRPLGQPGQRHGWTRESEVGVSPCFTWRGAAREAEEGWARQAGRCTTRQRAAWVLGLGTDGGGPANGVGGRHAG
jgi:hypothetical protein